MTAPPSVPPEEAGRILPLVDPDALRMLAEDVGPETAASFARDFVRIWPQRREALAAALQGTDLTRAIDAALSLRTSSVMVGASRLAALSEGLERRLRADGFDAAAGHLPEVAECGELTVDALREDDGGVR
ncbi:Hpt domain-containing protein [Sinomonas sp. JGH33]|uniref:Hpt domain-containing protein n=1 Tax=Sinomonas terricola TaxID=3110330 RepID=A0ABU5T2P2_9MICC|nr:Hpt domain-containing protein [Sinomonas sp. JGH33]MEA5453441.1 Hpt domain-containing protein [Sinomonas sp. JGH33]